MYVLKERERILKVIVQKKSEQALLVPKMERKTRFELATFSLARKRSTTEPLPHIKKLLPDKH